MIWFFAFTSLGALVTLFLLIARQAFRPGWKWWLSGAALMGALTLLVQKA